MLSQQYKEKTKLFLQGEKAKGGTIKKQRK
jgi:hypothetical protein